MGCGEIEFLEGGMLKNPTIIGGSISQSAIQGSVLDASDITQLRSIDTDSAAKIADAIAALPADKLQTLLDALFAALNLGDSGLVPDTTKYKSLPTLMYGDSRRGMLGAPDGWAKMGGKLIPLYTEADGTTGG